MAKMIATVGVIVMGVAAIVPAAWLIHAAPQHSNVAWSGRVLGMSLAAAALWLGVCLAVAWALWRADLRMAAQLLAIIGVIGAILGWKAIDAANVVFDRSPELQRQVELVEHVGSTPKREGYFVVTSPTASGAQLAVDLPLRSGYWQPGRRLVLTTRAGALGREYAVRLEPAEP